MPLTTDLVDALSLNAVTFTLFSKDNLYPTVPTPVTTGSVLSLLTLLMYHTIPRPFKTLFTLSSMNPEHAKY